MSSENKTMPANIIAVIGFAILFIVAIWSGIQIVKFAPHAFSGFSFFKSLKGAPSITLNPEKLTVAPEEETTLKWDLSGNVEGGTVSFMYKCAQNAVLDIYDDMSKEYKTLPCNTPYNMPLSIKSIKIKPHYTNTTVVDVPIAIVYTDGAGKKYEDIQKLTVKDSSATEESNPIATSTDEVDNTPDNKYVGGTDYNSGKEGVVSTPNRPVAPAVHTATTYHKKRSNRCVSKIYGTPDLSIHHIRTGVIARNGYFVQKSSFSKNDVVVIKFTVSNNGTKTSPAWKFQALLPKTDNPLYTSAYQPAIPPCSGRFYTVRVSNPRVGNQKITVSVDPVNEVQELNEINNSDHTSIQVY